MAGLDDPYAPPEPPLTWQSWEESPWAQYGAPGIPLQPTAPPDEIEMPPMDARPVDLGQSLLPPQERAPQIGFPTNPDEASLPSPLEHEPNTPAAFSMPPEPAPMQPGLGIPAEMLTDAAQGQFAADQMPPEPQGEIEFPVDQLDEGDRKASLQDMDSPDFASFAAENEIARQQDAAAKMATAARERAVDAENDFKIYQESRESARQERAAVESDAAKLAATEDPTWMESRSPGQMIAAFVAAIVGGLVQGRTGGRNDGLAMIERQIERYGVEQQQKRAQQRALIGDRRNAANDEIQAVEGDYRAKAAFEAAAWERTIQTIEADQANYDPAGTSAIRLEGVRREAIAKQQAALMAFEEQQIKRAEAIGKLNAEQQKQMLAIRKQAEDERNNRAQNKAAQTSAGASWKNATVNEKKTLAEIKALEAENAVVSTPELQRLYPNAPPEAFNIGATSLKKFEKHLATFGKAADVGKDQSEATIKGAQARLEGSGPSGSPYAVGLQDGSGLIQKDGTVFEIKDDVQRRRATDVIKTAQNIRRIADLVKILRADTGGASSIVGSKEYMDLTSLINQTDFETFVGYGLGAPSEGDKQLAAGVRGGKDATSFVYDASPGFEAYATGIEEKANTEVRSVGYTGDPIKLKRTEAVQAMERDVLQNMDVWSPPELLDSSVDPEIRKRAAGRAIDSAKTLAEQAPPAVVKQLVKENEQRLAEGLIDEKQAEKARNAFRKVYGRRIRDADRARNADELNALGVTPDTVQRRLVEGLDEAAFVDALLGIPKGGE